MKFEAASSRFGICTRRMAKLRRVLNVWTILFLCGFLQWIHGEFVPEDFEEKLTALAKVIDYVNRRPHQMNADAAFSITIVEANLATTLLHENSRYLKDNYWKTLATIFKLCDSIRKHLTDIIVPGNEDVLLLHKTLNNPALWMRPIFWKNGTLDNGSYNSNEVVDHNIRDLIMQGTPKEEESDECLSEIVRSKLSFRRRIPEICVAILKRRDNPRGYPLTHRLLIVRVAEAMNFDRDFLAQSSDLVTFYCSAIYRDLIDIEASGFPYSTPDLMMEQVLLCGMEGFLEFTSRHYEQLVLNWSRPSGCFSSFANRFTESQPQVSRRSSKSTDFGCDSHATGLAAATLSLFIRENVENSY